MISAHFWMQKEKYMENLWALTVMLLKLRFVFIFCQKQNIKLTIKGSLRESLCKNVGALRKQHILNN